MIVCLIKYQLKPDSQWEAERIADLILNRLRGHQGFMEYKFAENVDTGEYIGMAFWATKEHALDAHPHIYPFVTEILGHQCIHAIELFDLYYPKRFDAANDS